MNPDPLNNSDNPLWILGDGIGRITLEDHMGDDLSVVNAARVSFGKRSDLLDEKDEKLIEYMAKNGHTSPFEHVTFTFNIKCPLFVTRQWHRHRTWAYNEISRRYTSDGMEFFIPKTLRRQSRGEDKQQSDADSVISLLKVKDSSYWNGLEEVAVNAVLKDSMQSAVELYNELLAQGVAREQARMVLPQNMYTEFYGTVNLHNLMHFIRLRTSAHAQWEIKQYALEMLHLIHNVAPISVEAIQDTWND